MLLVKTKLGISSVAGIGLFANEFIPKGTKIWQFTHGLDLVITPTQLKIWPESVRQTILHYDFVDMRSKSHILCFDDSRFFNHSEVPNVIGQIVESEVYGINIAGKDIEVGEELLVNYKDFDANCLFKLGST